MKNRNFVVRSLTLFTAVLSFIFLRRLRNSRTLSDTKILKSRKEYPQLPNSEKILLETNEFFTGLPTINNNTNDDLTKIRGIGKKSETALRNAGVSSFKDLSNLTQAQIETILNEAGIKIIKCEGWQESARTLMG